jgi:hypothetical protein
MGIKKITYGKDYNHFEKVTVAIAPGVDFSATSDATFPFNRSSQMTFCLLLDGYGTVEYSFNGTHVHGELIAGTPSEAIFFDNRVVSGIWFRAGTIDAIGSTIRVEGWCVV